jgi:TetR/AcrR family transcriptional repressor of nem operon
MFTMSLDTRERLLRETEVLLRTKGYAAFSYADLAERIGIRKASIHHHFRTKEELGAALIDTYLVKFQADLAEILDQERETVPRLRRYAGFFTASMREGMMPLCGALSAETSALPLAMQQRVRHFFELHLAWLRTVLKEGVKAGELGPDLDVDETASLVLSALEGASLVAWALKDASVITPAFEQVVSRLNNSTSTNKPTRE